MSDHKVHFSSISTEWETPQWLFDQLNAEFGFVVDVCATDQNAKCRKYFTREQDGLKQPWHQYGVCWMNPPYGREIVRWVAKAAAAARLGATVVCLLPARTDTAWFHEYIWDTKRQRPKPGVEVRFLRGRLKFVGASSSAPFPSMVVVFNLRGNK